MHIGDILPGVALGAAGIAFSLTAITPADAARIKYCQGDHFHYGSSQGHPTKAKARAAAIRSWSEFTVFEYGDAWGRFKRGLKRRVRCSKDVDGWGCSVEAVPCRFRKVAPKKR